MAALKAQELDTVSVADDLVLPDLVLSNTRKDATSKKKGILGNLSRKITNHFFADQMALLRRLSPKAKARPQFDVAQMLSVLFLSQPCTY